MFEGYESASRVTTSAGGSYPQRVSADEDRDERRARLKRIRSILAFAGLYQVTHEMIKQVVLGHVRDHYSWGSDKARMHYDSDAYKRDVLSKDKSPFRASLLWLVEAGAITLAQADRPGDIYEHRHDLTHELDKYVFSSDMEPDVGLSGEAVEILRDISYFWTQIMIDLGALKEFGDLTLDQVTPGRLVLLQMCIDAHEEH